MLSTCLSPGQSQAIVAYFWETGITNGSNAEAMRLKNEFKTFLEEELKLELSKEKTHITHVNEGFDFLGFHVQRYASAHHRKPGLFYSWTLLRPQKPGFLVYLWLLVANFSKKPGF